MTNLDDVGELERATREAMQTHGLVWASGPEWVESAFGGPPSAPPMISIIRGRMQSTATGRTVLVDAGDALWFWQDARNLAFNWHRFGELGEEDRALLWTVDGQDGSRELPSNAHCEAFDRLEAVGLIKSTPAGADARAVQITLLGRRFLRWGT